MVKVKTNASGTSSTGYVMVYAYGTADGGTTYSNGATGTDGSFTLGTNVNLLPLGRIGVGANSTTYYGGPWSVATVFGGSLPDHWGIIVENESGATLDASVGSAFYQGVFSQYT